MYVCLYVCSILENRSSDAAVFFYRQFWTCIKVCSRFDHSSTGRHSVDLVTSHWRLARSQRHTSHHNHFYAHHHYYCIGLTFSLPVVVLGERRLRWLGHVIRMDHQCVPRQALHCLREVQVVCIQTGGAQSTTARNRSEWHRSVADCICFDAGWIRFSVVVVKVLGVKNIVKTAEVAPVLLDGTKKVPLKTGRL